MELNRGSQESSMGIDRAIRQFVVGNITFWQRKWGRRCFLAVGDPFAPYFRDRSSFLQNVPHRIEPRFTGVFNGYR